MKTIDGKYIIPERGKEYVLLEDYNELYKKTDNLERALKFYKGYIKGLKKIIYKQEKGLELSDLEMWTLIQSMEDNGETYEFR